MYAVTGLTSETVVKGTSQQQNNIGINSQTLISQINNIEGDTPTEIGKVYTWNQKSGQGASSSGTIHGIYDLSGGMWERTAAYIANGNENLTKYGKSLLSNGNPTEEKSTKYVTVYAYVSDDDTDQKNYEMAVNKRKFGNAMHETSTNGTGSTSWRKDYSMFVSSIAPFSIRGGSWYNRSVAGLFCFSRNDGIGRYNFRVSCGFSWYVAFQYMEMS